MSKHIQYFLSSLMLWCASGVHAQVTTIPFEYYERLIFLNIQVDNTNSLLFLFDTGANASAIDTRAADALRLKTIKTDSVEGTAGVIVVPYVKAGSVAAGQSVVKDILFTKYDLGGSLAPPGRRLDGILGTDFLRHFVVTIDFPNRQMTLSKTLVDTFPTSFPFELENGIPRVMATINDQVPAWFRYDSGSSLFETKDIYLNTTTPVFDMLAKADTTLRPVTRFSATGVGGTVELPVYKINSVSLNTIDILQPFIIVQPRQGYFARPDAVGFFGNNLVEQFRKVAIDFVGKRMYILKTELRE